MLNLIFTVFVSLFASITTQNSGDQFKVAFSPGAVASCIIFQDQTLSKPSPNFPDGHFTFRSCVLLLDSGLTSYVEGWPIPKEDTDWVIWAEVQFPDDKGGYPSIETNKLRIHH